MNVVREAFYDDCGDLVVIDFDDVNCQPIDRSAFEAARRWLWQKPNRRGVFANSAPFYYDLWPLRHPTWCPDDCWKRVRKAERALGLDAAVRQYVASRQIPIAPDAAPIMVDSAFGGLGIYRRQATLEARYVGIDPDNDEVCDHVSFNATVKGEDGVLAIYPALRNHSPIEHIVPALRAEKTITLEQDGAKCRLIGPPDHEVERFRAFHPLYGRRLPTLARIVSNNAPGENFVDCAANIGDTIGVARLAGATMPITAVEASVTHCKYLWANLKHKPGLFADTRLIWGNVGATRSQGAAEPMGGLGLGRAIENAPTIGLAELAPGDGVSLLKTDTRGIRAISGLELPLLKKHAPILWIQAQSASAEDESACRALLRSLAAQWPMMILFDNFGFAMAAGETSDLANRAADLMAYARRQREQPRHQPTLYYLDVALFPKRFGPLYDEFRQSLPELDC